MSFFSHPLRSGIGVQGPIYSLINKKYMYSTRPFEQILRNHDSQKTLKHKQLDITINTGTHVNKPLLFWVQNLHIFLSFGVKWAINKEKFHFDNLRRLLLNNHDISARTVILSEVSWLYMLSFNLISPILLHRFQILKITTHKHY